MTYLFQVRYAINGDAERFERLLVIVVYPHRFNSNADRAIDLGEMNM